MDSVNHPQARNGPQNFGGAVQEYLINGIGDGGGGYITKELDMRLDGILHPPSILLQIYEGCVHYIHQKVSNPPSGYNCHDGGWTGIPLSLGCVSITIAINLKINVIIELELDDPNGGVDLNLGVRINLNHDIPNGELRYKKVAHRPVKLGGGK